MIFTASSGHCFALQKFHMSEAKLSIDKIFFEG